MSRSVTLIATADAAVVSRIRILARVGCSERAIPCDEVEVRNHKANSVLRHPASHDPTRGSTGDRAAQRLRLRVRARYELEELRRVSAHALG